MPDEADLIGCTVLVVKDDYFIAMDAGRAVQRTGGVFGPVAHEHQALDLIADSAPTCAAVDINLGDGPRFAVSEAKQDAGIPFGSSRETTMSLSWCGSTGSGACVSLSLMEWWPVPPPGSAQATPDTRGDASRTSPDPVRP
jgi:hypothetical protein